MLVTDKLSGFVTPIPATTMSPFPPRWFPRKLREAVAIEYFVSP